MSYLLRRGGVAFLLWLAWGLPHAYAAQVTFRIDDGGTPRTVTVDAFERDRVTYVALGGLLNQMGGRTTVSAGQVEARIGNRSASIALGRADATVAGESFTLRNRVLEGRSGEIWIALEDVAPFFSRAFNVTPEPVDPNALADSEPQPSLPSLDEPLPLPDLPTDVRPHRVPVVVLDPGHGGNDVGIEGRSVLEKNFTLSLAQRLQAAFSSLGIKAELVRSGDEALPLIARVNKAIEFDGQVFISIHAGASHAGSASGFEIFYPTDTGLGESSGTGTRAIKPVERYRFSQDSRLLAESVARAVQEQAGVTLRGVHAIRSPLLQHVPMPGLLIEAGMLTNPTEEDTLKSVEYQDRFAAAVADAVRRYLGIPAASAPEGFAP